MPALSPSAFASLATSPPALVKALHLSPIHTRIARVVHPAPWGGLADNRLSRYSAAMSDFVRAITTGTGATAISIMGITTIALPAGPGVRR